MLREVAEYPNSFVPLGPRDERIETDRYTLCMAAGDRWNTVQRQRFEAAELDEVIEEVRGILRARGRASTQWEVGSAARPEGLVEMLVQRGIARDSDPLALALVLSRPPPAGPDGVLARRVESYEEYAAGCEVQWEAFATPAAERDDQRAGLPERWAESTTTMHVALIDGEVVAAGTCAPTAHGLVLFGGATLPRARGQGAYRAVIAARWAQAVSAGTPALLTQAGRMSAPILARLGFERVGTVDMLIDAF